MGNFNSDNILTVCEAINDGEYRLRFGGGGVYILKELYSYIVLDSNQIYLAYLLSFLI